MRNVAVFALAAASSLLSGCRSKPAQPTSVAQAASPQATSGQSEVSQANLPQSPIDIVRDGYLEYNRTTTIGKALAGTFQNGVWKTFTSEKGAVVVEFDASEPFGEVTSISCAANTNCVAIAMEINDYCKSTAGQTPYLKIYQDEQEALKAKIEASAAAYKGTAFDQGTYDLKEQLWNLPNAEDSCETDVSKHHANDPVPIAVQFTVNHDGTFQYHANSMGLNSKELVAKIYE